MVQPLLFLSLLHLQVGYCIYLFSSFYLYILFAVSVWLASTLRYSGQNHCCTPRCRGQRKPDLQLPPFSSENDFRVLTFYRSHRLSLFTPVPPRLSTSGINRWHCSGTEAAGWARKLRGRQRGREIEGYTGRETG